ncbi:hypothetical protein VHEMI00271 [[Torrubiella] hemipterigena]|uniref:Uncharacterized protein n=1 Tax=[Torrubiella] hemipterigena TaxID=1531966 RepID=A0A0A1SQ00_9HYPO|nr:hypothetical protein VHEMI00271 [[Torrubiella] hemipterigena]
MLGWVGSDEMVLASIHFIVQISIIRTNVIIGGKDYRGNPLPPKEFERNENLVTFLARLATATEVPYSNPRAPATDFTYWALHDFRDVFKNPDYSSQIKNWRIRNWCLWLTHGSERMLTNIQHEPCFPKTRVSEAMQMRPEDWGDWRKETLAARPAYGDQVKEMIDAAMKSMDRAEAMHGIPFRRFSAKVHSDILSARESDILTRGSNYYARH